MNSVSLCTGIKIKRCVHTYMTSFLNILVAFICSLHSVLFSYLIINKNRSQHNNTRQNISDHSRRLKHFVAKLLKYFSGPGCSKHR